MIWLSLPCIDLIEKLKQAAVAVQSGVCIDIFAVTDEYTDLASLKFLSIESGGSLFLYANTDDSTLPQDMYVWFNEYFICVLFRKFQQPNFLINVNGLFFLSCNSH